MGKLGNPPDLDSGDRRFESFWTDGVIGVKAAQRLVKSLARDRYPHITPCFCSSEEERPPVERKVAVS